MATPFNRRRMSAGAADQRIKYVCDRDPHCIRRAPDAVDDTFSPNLHADSDSTYLKTFNAKGKAYKQQYEELLLKLKSEQQTRADILKRANDVLVSKKQLREMYQELQQQKEVLLGQLRGFQPLGSEGNLQYQETFAKIKGAIVERDQLQKELERLKQQNPSDIINNHVNPNPHGDDDDDGDDDDNSTPHTSDVTTSSSIERYQIDQILPIEQAEEEDNEDDDDEEDEKTDLNKDSDEEDEASKLKNKSPELLKQIEENKQLQTTIEKLTLQRNELEIQFRERTQPLQSSEGILRNAMLSTSTTNSSEPQFTDDFLSTYFVLSVEECKNLGKKIKDLQAELWSLEVYHARLTYLNEQLRNEISQLMRSDRQSVILGLSSGTTPTSASPPTSSQHTGVSPPHPSLLKRSITTLHFNLGMEDPDTQRDPPPAGSLSLAPSIESKEDVERKRQEYEDLKKKNMELYTKFSTLTSFLQEFKDQIRNSILPTSGTTSTTQTSPSGSVVTTTTTTSTVQSGNSLITTTYTATSSTSSSNNNNNTPIANNPITSPTSSSPSSPIHSSSSPSSSSSSLSLGSSLSLPEEVIVDVMSHLLDTLGSDISQPLSSKEFTTQMIDIANRRKKSKKHKPARATSEKKKQIKVVKVKKEKEKKRKNKSDEEVTDDD